MSNGQRLDPRRGIAATAFYDQIKALFAASAGVLRGQGDATSAERFERASTHWMRHSHAGHAIASGMPIEIAQQYLGHPSLPTTTTYVTPEKRRPGRYVVGIASADARKILVGLKSELRHRVTTTHKQHRSSRIDISKAHS